jgi:hypothetical protein
VTPPFPLGCADASAANTEDLELGLKPLHRSPAAVRVEGVEVAGFEAALLDALVPFAGAEVPNTACPPREVVPTVAPLSRWVNWDLTPVLTGATVPEPTRGWVRGAVTVPWFPPVTLVGAVAPLVERALVPGVATGAGAAGVTGVAAGAGVTAPVPVDPPADGVLTVEGGAGVAGVPNPDGVQPHARPTPRTPMPSTDNAAKPNVRARLCM